MKCEFIVGQKVVCISTDENFDEVEILTLDYDAPEVGRIYTIREIFISNANGEVGLKLVEIPDQRVYLRFAGQLGTGILAWSPRNFRPLVKRQTDISVFTAMLAPAGRLPVDA